MKMSKSDRFESLMIDRLSASRQTILLPNRGIFIIMSIWKNIKVRSSVLMCNYTDVCGMQTGMSFRENSLVESEIETMSGCMFGAKKLSVIMPYSPNTNSL